ncbi:MAG: hypothetical protein WA991_14800 [Ornithinimicrobium sp.]
MGVVIARNDTILATGFKGEDESLHADEVALEPCANSRTSRVPCADLIAAAGSIATVHIGEYHPNPQVNRLGWKTLRDRGVKLRNFPTDLRAKTHEVGEGFTKFFTIGTGMSAGAKFDFTTNGGVFMIRADEHSDAAPWKTR